MKTLLLLCSLLTVAPAADWQAQVVGVKGGNSLEVLQGGKVYAIGLYGIECLAAGEPLGKAARKVSFAAFMTEVRVAIVSPRADGGFIAKVTLADGRDLSAELVSEGLAWWDEEGYPDEKTYALLEKSARESFRGVWATPEDEADTDWGRTILARRDSPEKAASAALLTAN